MIDLDLKLSFFVGVGCLLFISLGLWQLDRAKQKRIYYQRYLERQAEPAVDINILKTPQLESSELLWRLAKVTGRFDESVQLLLDNQVVKHQAGYFVFTLMVVSGTDKQLLVNRGWVPVGPDRSILPNLINTNTEVSLTGMIKPPPSVGIHLKEALPEEVSKGIYRLTAIDIEALSGFLKVPLYPYIFRLGPHSQHGYYREWQPPKISHTRHIGYAFQWFLFALVLIVFYGISLKSRRDAK